MEVRNKVGSDRSDLYRGSGQLGSTLDYLMYNDPSTYYYQKLRSTNNQYLRDDYWSEAARRGETDQLLASLLSWENLDSNLQAAKKELESFTQTGDEEKDNKKKKELEDKVNHLSNLNSNYLDKVKDYADKGYEDYNTYMLAMTLPLFDDPEKKERVDEASGYNFGSYTDKEWAEKVLDSIFERYDVQIAEAEKENMNWFQKVGATIGSGLLSFVGGVVNFFGDVVNLGEGILNCFFNFSDDATWNDRFLWAFSDESTGFFEQAGDLFNDMAYKVAYESTDMVNMVDAYDAGYRPASWEGMIFGTDRSQGVGASYRTWGKWWSGAFSSIGYMLPSMVISAGVSAIPGGAAIAGKVGTSVFYSGIFSGNISDTVSAAANEGISYKDLNAGEVVSNGLIKAGLQWAVEVALGKILGFSGLDQAIGIGRGAGKFGNLVGGMGGKLGAIGVTALRAGRSMAKEGLEEVLQDMSDSFVDAIYGTTNSKIADLYSSRALETINPMNLLESFVVGALTEGVISSLQGVKYILPKNRAVQTDIDGNVQAMGFFQTLNFNAALETMNDWNNILNDSKATTEAKADVAMKMSAAINTIGSVLKSFGQSDALKVNQILDIYAAGEKKTELLEKANLSNEQYATKLYDSFLTHYAEVERKYVPKPLKTKIKETFAKLADKFKKKGVTEVNNIITNKIDGNDPDVPLKSNNVENFKAALEKLGAEAIIGTNGNIITKSEDIVVVPNKLLETGDLATIIQGVAFDQVQQAVISALSPAQRKMIVRQYEKATGTTCTTEQAVQALLFDKAFYTRILLASEEGHKYNVEALQVLATINKVVQAKASPLLKNGKLANDAYNVLMQKIQKTMQTGLVTYCTKYARIDLGEITNDILSPELKEVIKNHQNTIFSEFVDEGIKDTKTQAPDSERTTRFDTYLQKFSSSLSAEEITELKQKARSTNVNDRVDAYTMLTVLSRNSTSPNATKDKLVYLPTSPDGIIEREHLQNVEKFFGLTWAELISGNYDASKITQEGRNFIQAQYDMSDRASRLACIRDALFNISGGTLTVGMDGSILEIMEKDKFVKDKYLGKEGTKAFRDDLRKGVIKTVADVVKVDLKNSTIKNMKLVRSDTLNGAKGAFVYGDDHISFSAGADVNTFMHELTHVTQYALDVTGQSATGGYAGMFKYMTPEAAKSLDNYIAEKFPLTYNYMVNHKISTYNTIYFMLAGELQANSTLGTHMFDVGFTFDKAGTVLVSPDGKERWNLKANQSDAQKQFRRNVAKARRELSKEIKNQQQANTTENTQTTKATTEAKTETKAASQLDERTTKALDEVVNKNVKKATRATINQVNNATLYKGMNVSKVTEFDNTKGNKKRIVSNAIWLTDNKNVAESYANNKRASATVYDSKVSISNPLVIDAKGQAFSSIMGNITSDQIAVYAQEHGYDSLVIKNVLDIGPYLGNVTNRENSMKPSTDVVIFDKTKAKITNETKYSEDETLDNLDKEYTATKQEDRGQLVGANKKTQDAFNNLSEDAIVQIMNSTSEDVDLTPEEEQYGLELAKALKIRRLTPKEEFALMGVKAEDFARIAANQSDASLYHLAGDSIIVDVLKNIFDKLYTDGYLTKPVRLIEFFAGYGAQNFALDYLGKDYESWKIAEWAVKSIQAYKDAHHSTDTKDYAANMTKSELLDYLVNIGVSLNYNSPAGRESLNTKSLQELKDIYNNIQATHNLVNIQKVTGESLEITDTDSHDYVLTYSFPCQDLSRAGKRAGMHGQDTSTGTQLSLFETIENASQIETQTRSGLLWEVDRILKELYDADKPLPQVLIMENVPEVHNSVNRTDFKQWLSNLQKYGYTNSYTDIKGSDYGIPQKRVRTIMVSTLNNKAFTFPAKQQLKSSMMDYLDKNVDNKYYLTDKQARTFMSYRESFDNNKTTHPINTSIASTLTTKQEKRAQGGNFYSPLVDNDVDLYDLLHPTKNSVQNTIDALNQVKAGQKITASQQKMWSEDRDLSLNKNSRRRNKMTQEELNKYNRDRYITNKEARKSNLKYYIQKGVTIRLHPGVAAFVEATTHDFTKLPTILQNKIVSGKLLYSDILDYINTAANMDDYTFKAIAKYVFNNERLAKLDVKTLLKLEDSLHEFAMAAYLTKEPDKYLTPKQMADTYKEVIANSSPEKIEWAQKFTENIVRTDRGGHNKYIEAIPQTNQLNESFFKKYDGTLAGMREINNLAKAVANIYDTHQVARENQKTATVEYDYSTTVIIKKNDDISKTLDSIDKVEKMNTIEAYYTDVLIKRLQEKMATEGIRPDKEAVIALRRKIDDMVDDLDKLSDTELNAKYLEVLNQNSQQKKSLSAVTATATMQRTPYEEQERSIKNIKDTFRGVGRTMTRWLKSTEDATDTERFYNRLPDNIKKWFDPNNGYKLVSDYYKLSKQEILDLQSKIQAARDQVKHWVKAEEATKVALKKSKERLSKLQKEYKTYREKTEATLKENKTLRQKVQVEHVVRIEGTNVTSSSPSNRVVEEILKTSWNKKRMGEVQELDNNIEHAVANANTFFKENANTLLSASTTELEEAIAFFANNTTKLTEDEFARFNALRTYFFGWVLEANKNGQITLNANLKQQVNNIMRNMASNYGTGLAVWNNIRQRLNPLDSMRSQDIEVGGITLNDDLKDKLFDAIESNDVDVMTKTYEEITEWLDEQQSSKKGVLRRIVGVRSMAMLSSPLTWLRNKMSNFMLKRLNTLSSKIGNAMFKGKTMAGQLKMNQQVTPEIQKFITDNIIDNGFFDTFVSNLSKFNVSDIVAKNQNKIAKGETLTREEITTHLVLKAIYNEYYNNNMFKSKLLNDLHKNLMKVMSDDSYVREAAVRYFGKILAEKKYSLKDGKMTDAIMNDFSTAIGLALNDYMHSDNFFNNVERWLSDRSELGWFAYKLIMPYAASSWNWFKAAIRYSPIGLGRAIYRITHLEQQVAKAEADYIAGKSNVSPELTEYLIRRDLGSGVIGTVAMGLGALLAGLGFMRLEDDDYGKPKLHIGNLVIDVSDIFGSSSVLAGAAFVTGIQEKGWTWEGVLDALNRLADVTIDDLPVMDIVQMDMYSNGSFDMGLNQLESIALSFIPNILSWFAGLTYTGTLNKQTFLDRALAKIPFAARLVEKKVDPYTGKTDSWADWVGRAVPYFSWDAASQNERKTTALGLTKTMLRGQYKVNGEDFNVTGKDLTEINKTYGTLNAEDLTKFYENKLAVSVKQENGKYKTMTYNQMTTKQRQNAVSSIMQNNADLVKIIAWLKAGNKYYASSTIYNKLVKLGITKNLYRGSKGFVKG